MVNKMPGVFCNDPVTYHLLGPNSYRDIRGLFDHTYPVFRDLPHWVLLVGLLEVRTPFHG